MAIRIKLLTQLFESGICQIFKRYILNNSFSKKKLAALRKCMLKIYLLYRLLSYYSISKSNCKMGHQTPDPQFRVAQRQATMGTWFQEGQIFLQEVLKLCKQINNFIDYGLNLYQTLTHATKIKIKYIEIQIF